MRDEPNGIYARRAWFLFERLTGRTLDAPDAGNLAYADALSPELHVVAKDLPSRRHKVTDNLLGVPGFCPFVRRTARLDAFLREPVDAEARALVAECAPDVLARAVSYLYTKETRSSFEIEHETPGGRRAGRFVAALRSPQSVDPSDPASLVALQNVIVDPRYAAAGFRTTARPSGATARSCTSSARARRTCRRSCRAGPP